MEEHTCILPTLSNEAGSRISCLMNASYGKVHSKREGLLMLAVRQDPALPLWGTGIQECGFQSSCSDIATYSTPRRQSNKHFKTLKRPDCDSIKNSQTRGSTQWVGTGNHFLATQGQACWQSETLILAVGISVNTRKMFEIANWASGAPCVGDGGLSSIAL